MGSPTPSESEHPVDLSQPQKNRQESVEFILK